MHVLLGYYESKGKTREERVQGTLRTVGSPVLIGALSTFLGVLPLAFSSSAVMRTVFISFFSMVTLGCGHGLIFLPVVLSSVGPEDCGPASYEEALAKRDQASDKVKPDQLASCGDVFKFVWTCGFQTQIVLAVGWIAALMNGVVYPAIAFLFAAALSSLSNATSNFDEIREVSFYFLLLGVYVMVVASVQTAAFEIVATRAARKLRLQWFEALLRQDCAYFDVKDVSSVAASIEPNASTFQLGLGRKLGEGIEFSTAFVGGIAFAFYSSWRLALVILAVLPVSMLSAFAVVTISQSKSHHTKHAYAKAGGVAYSTVSAIKTVLSLNAIPDATTLYTEATKEAFRRSIAGLWKEGLATGEYGGHGCASFVETFSKFSPCLYNFQDAWLLRLCCCIAL